MSVEENKALVRRLYESGFQEIMRGNVDVAHEYFADHYHDHTSLHPEQPGVHGVKEVMADVGQAAPDMRHEVLAIAGEDDLVFVHWQATGTHEGQYEVVKHARDVQPTGEEATVSGISLFRIEGGKFVEGWHYHGILEYALEHGMAGAPSDSS
jgi:predicted SnoaL-like aldol condensation-catalyzing enzyme